MSLWEGEFGNDYTKREQSSVDNRRAIWRRILPLNCRSILEVGANKGANLEAIALLTQAELYATEPNDMAREELINSGFVHPSKVTAEYADKLSWPDGVADLVITSGLLIHIEPKKLLQSMAEIHRCARRWIICAEYFAPQEEMIPYRGTHDTLWRRDYGSLWLDNFTDLNCTGCVFAWKRMSGLDNLTFWILEKNYRRH